MGISQKHLMKSKTVLGVLVSILPTLAPTLGFTFSEEEGKFLTASIDSLITAVGALFAIYGRYVAKSQLKVKG